MKSLYRKITTYLKTEPLDYVVFLISCVSFMFMSIVSIPLDFSLGFPPNAVIPLVVSLVVSILVNALLLFLSIRARKAAVVVKIAFVLNLYSIFTYMWFLSGGINGPTLLYLVLLFFLSILLSNSLKLTLFFAGLNGLTVVSLLWVNRFHPDLIVQYESQQARIADIATSYVFLLLLVGVVGTVLLSGYKRLHSKLVVDEQQAKKLSYTDTLTQLWNRRFINEQLDKEMQRFLDQGTLLSVILLDIDFFKAVNDTFGHDVGDAVLVQVSRIIAKNLRRSDILARYGGEEFLVALPETDAAQAFHLAERIRLAVGSSEFEILSGRPVHVSGGVATTQEGIRTTDDLLKASDSNLYKAKSQGRDRIIGSA